MQHLTSIVAMDLNGAIGSDNRLPWRLRSDLRLFRQITMGSVVVMGRLTFESLGSKPLPNRYNIVLSHGSQLFIEASHGRAAHSIEEALLVASSAAAGRECFIVGGQSVYEQFAQFVDSYVVTVVNKIVDGADTFLDPDKLFGSNEWRAVASRRYRGDGVHDETDFAICELHSSNTKSIRKHRDDVIADYRRRARQLALRKQVVRTPPRAKAGLTAHWFS